MKSLVEDELVRAVTCHDKSCLYLAFSELEMDSSAWLELPERACINHVPKLKSASCINIRRNLEAKYMMIYWH